MTYRIISCGWNCDPDPCINSVRSQTITSWTHHVRMDGEWWHNEAGKGTVSNHPAGGLMPKNRQGMAANIWGAIASGKFDDDDVICLLDLDDKLAGPDVLSRLDFFYGNRNILLTYGSYRCMSGDKPYVHGPYRKNEDIRRAKYYRGTHLKTFRYRLWKHLPQSALFDRNGGWLKTCSDLALMVPLMEMAGFDACRHINDVLVDYNDLNPYNDHKVNGGQMGDDRAWIQGQPRFDRVFGCLTK